MTTQAERLARVEEQVKALTDNFNEHKEQTNNEFKELNQKLDDILALRNKGVGVFWLISSLIGTGIVGGALQFFRWFIGEH
jgi:hypothetical protein